MFSMRLNACINIFVEHFEKKKSTTWKRLRGIQPKKASDNYVLSDKEDSDEEDMQPRKKVLLFSICDVFRIVFRRKSFVSHRFP